MTWREGTRHPLRSRFAAVRIRAAHRDHKLHQPRESEWVMIEWPRGEAEPTKYWMSNLAENTRLRDMVALGKQRWIIERDYQELKQELGLGHFEGRGWRGFHHHATLCIARLWLPGGRTESLFPLGKKRPSWTISSPTPARLPATGIESGRSGITHNPSPLYASSWLALCFSSSADVRFVALGAYNTVVLEVQVKFRKAAKISEHQFSILCTAWR